MAADLRFDSFVMACRSYWVMVPTGGTGPDKEQRMAGRQSWDAIAQLADWSRPTLAA